MTCGFNVLRMVTLGALYWGFVLVQSCLFVTLGEGNQC